MIAGLGHDVVELERIRRIVEGPTGEAFLLRILTAEELGFARSGFGEKLNRRWVEYAAGRFAAKEAVVKALGCGVGGKAGFQDVSIVPDAAGKPVCQLSKLAWGRLGLKQEHTAIHVTITHSGTLASAVAVVEQRSPI